MQDAEQGGGERAPGGARRFFSVSVVGPREQRRRQGRVLAEWTTRAGQYTLWGYTVPVHIYLRYALSV